MDACAQAEVVRLGEIAPRELVEEAIARIERLNPALNAVITPLFDEARAAAAGDLPDGPFRGVPFLLKDIGAHQAGQPQYMGSALLRDLGFAWPDDSPLGRRFRAAGLVTLGKTNTPELGHGATTQPRAFGPTRNPWDPARSPAGSSGGSAVAVATGMVAAAHGNDYGGSIRLPAGWCGVVGLKPSRGRVSWGGTLPGRNAIEGVLTRTVRDTAALLDVIAGGEPGDLYVAPPPGGPYAEEVGTDPGRLRVGLLLDASAIGGVHPECARAVESTARVLLSLGHAVEDAQPVALFDEGARAADLAVRCAGTARNLARVEDLLLGRPATPDDCEPLTWWLAERGRRMSAADLLAAEQAVQVYASTVASWWAPFDLLVTPTAPEPPMLLEEMLPPDEILGEEPPFRLGRMLAMTIPFNITGQPAVSLPLGWTADGLPVGVQLVAAYAREDVLIRVAAQLEEAMPWAERHPPAG